MKISLLQPEIERGNIKNNISHIQNLIDKSKGDISMPDSEDILEVEL